jgi:hypothetical protein
MYVAVKFVYDDVKSASLLRDFWCTDGLTDLILITGNIMCPIETLGIK